MFKKNFYLIIFLSVLILVALLIYIKPYYELVHEITGVSPLKILITNGSYKKNDSKVTIVLLGKAGGLHDGPNLTDSIIVASYDISKNRVTVISLPRDIWSTSLSDKINSAYAYGEAKKKGAGMVLAKAEVGAIVGLPIHYAVVIDFDKFKELIDYFGGIDVVVDKSFNDNKFPISGRENDTCNGDLEYKCRYESVSFKQGLQHMNGETALKYVRSRNAQGEEGTDFARNKRQEKILKSMSEKIMSTARSRDLNKIRGMYYLLDKIIARDISNPEAAYIVKKIITKKGFNINQFALSEDLFIVPKKSDYKGKYVLIPTNGSFGSIHGYVRCLIEKADSIKCH